MKYFRVWSLSIFVLLIGTTVSYSAPGFGGGQSFWRVKSVAPISAQTFAISEITNFNQIDAGPVEYTNLAFLFDLSYAFTNNVEMYGEIPFLSRSNGDSESGIGDGIFGAKFAFPGTNTGVLRMGLDLFVIAPLGDEEKGFSNDSADFGARAIFDFNLKPFHFTVNSGYLAAENFSPYHRNRLLNGVAAAYNSQSIQAGLEFSAETVIQDEMSLTKSPVRISPFATYKLPMGLGLILAGDFSLADDDIIIPDFEINFGINYTFAPRAKSPQAWTKSDSKTVPARDLIAVDEAGISSPMPSDPNRDRDNDGLVDAIDRCPLQAEDKDGFQDEDGCPDPDNDGDGIHDIADGAPNDPETLNNYYDSDGVPDDPTGRAYPDADRDGIPDSWDLAVYDPEDYDGWEDWDGKPDVDNDGDGILDIHDTEPNRRGAVDLSERKDWNPYRIPANEPRSEDARYAPTTVQPGTSDMTYTPPPSTTTEAAPKTKTPPPPGLTKSVPDEENMPGMEDIIAVAPETAEKLPPVTKETPLDHNNVPIMDFPVIRFDAESSDVGDDMLKTVEQIAGFMLNYPRLVIGLTGYSLPEERLFSPQTNLGLQRAEAIKRQLILAHGISSTRMEITGVELTDSERTGTERDRGVLVKALGFLK